MQFICLFNWNVSQHFSLRGRHPAKLQCFHDSQSFMVTVAIICPNSSVPKIASYRSRPRSYFISMNVFNWRVSALMDYRLEKRDAHLALMSSLYDSPYSSAPLIPTFLLALIRFNVFNGTYANDSVFILFPLIK